MPKEKNYDFCKRLLWKISQVDQEMEMLKKEPDK